MTAENLRSKRAARGISGQSVCEVLGDISRAKLSAVERGYILASPEELQRINDAIDLIAQSRDTLSRLAADAGLSVAGLRL